MPQKQPVHCSKHFALIDVQVVSQSSLRSLQQLPDTAELQRASHALYVAMTPERKWRELKPGHTSFCERQERPLLGFLLCQNHCRNGVKAGLPGRRILDTGLVASLNSLFCIPQTLQEPGDEEKMHLEKGSTAG